VSSKIVSLFEKKKKRIVPDIKQQFLDVLYHKIHGCFVHNNSNVLYYFFFSIDIFNRFKIRLRVIIQPRCSTISDLEVSIFGHNPTFIYPVNSNDRHHLRPRRWRLLLCVDSLARTVPSILPEMIFCVVQVFYECGSPLCHGKKETNLMKNVKKKQLLFKRICKRIQGSFRKESYCCRILCIYITYIFTSSLSSHIPGFP
jgi:hypothetical protein